MRTVWLSALLAALFVLVVQPVRAAEEETATYSDNGITFKYPKDWKVTAEDKGATFITVAKDPGTQVIIQLYKAEAPPKLIMQTLDQSFRKSFEGKLVKGSDVTAKRKLLGEEREGQALAFEVAKGITFNFEIYALPLPSKKKTLGVVLMSSNLSDDTAKKGFTIITASLDEKK